LRKEQVRIRKSPKFRGPT